MSVPHRTVVLLALAVLCWVPSAAQETTENQEQTPPTFEEALPIRVPVQLKGDETDLRLELVIHRWSDRGDQDEDGQRFRVSVVEQPAFVQDIRWEDGPELDFAPGEHSKTVSMIFDTAADGDSGLPEEDAKLVLLVKAEHEAVIPPERELEIPLHFTRALQPGDAAVTVCALREDAPEDFPVEEAHQYCDPERVPVLRTDRVVVFVTPARDLRVPIGDEQDFSLQILGPNGDKVGGFTFWNEGSEEQPELSVPFTTEGSPGRFAVELNLWRPNEDPDPARARTGPGTYTVQTVDVRVEGSAVFGQGEATTYIDGEWVDEGTFEIGGVRLAFAGFIAEQVNELPLPDGVYPGTITIDTPRVTGSSVSIDLRARWQSRPDRPEQRAHSRLSLDFPEELRPDYDEVGGFDATLEILEQSDESFPLFLTAAVHHMVTTKTRPPDRHLVQSGTIPKFWEKLEQGSEGCSGGYWLWKQGEGNPFFHTEPTEGRCTLTFELGGGDLRAAFGDPERGLASHLHDPETLWVIPISYSLADDEHPWSRSRAVDVRSYGYAIYAVEPYTGPGPTGRPPSGEGEGVPGVEPSGDEESGTDTEVGTGTGTGTGTPTEEGTDTDTRTTTTVVPPPPPTIDTSNPGALDPDRQPQVANLIREWLHVAEPPESAVPGVDFDYDEFGRKIGGGGATGRTIGRHDTVDYGAGVSSEARVWSALRTELDSIDHCILEEYVVARLDERSIAHCRGRYGAVRNLGGVALAEARAEVQGGGFEVQLAPGPPAPSPELDGTVEGQDPPPTQYLRRGQTLTLTVYAPYVPEATVPDLVGLSRAEAKERLEDEGLIVVLRPGAPARSPAESDTIESQEPEAGTVLEPGAEVAVWVRPVFVAAATIPDLVGLSTGEARAALAAAGIDGTLIDLVPGSPAPTPAQAGRVEAQEPAAGWTVEPGTRVRLTVHSGFVDLRTVPSVIGLSTGEAKQRLAAVGLEVRLAPGPPAPSPGAENTVQMQSPDGGASVSSDSVVTLTVHSPWVPPPRAVPPPPPTAVPPIAVPTAVSGTGGGLLPLPDLRCPEYVILRSSSDLCIGNNPNAPPVGSRLPLDRQKSGYNHSPGAVQYGRYSFECYYRIEPYSKNFMFIRWEHGQYQGPGYPVPCQDRREGGRFGGNYSFYSPTHHVEAMLNGNCFNAQENEATARSLIRQTEPFARPCAGAVVQPPTPVPPPPTNTPVPPAAPPQCPGPNAPAIFTLIDPPPYAGRSAVCRDAGDNLWINVANNVRPVTSIQQGTKDPNSECWWGTSVVTPVHTYQGTLCR
jgi:beta-lactam-binding protein with PASTA domain